MRGMLVTTWRQPSSCWALHGSRKSINSAVGPPREEEAELDRSAADRCQDFLRRFLSVPAAVNKRLRFVCCALAILRIPDQVNAQFAEANRYDNSPVGVNQLELAYAYTHSNASIDTSLIVGGAKFNLNQGAITYTRYFGL